MKDDSNGNLLESETIGCRKLSDKVNGLACPIQRVNQIQLECKTVVKLTRSDTLRVIWNRNVVGNLEIWNREVVSCLGAGKSDVGNPGLGPLGRLGLLAPALDQ